MEQCSQYIFFLVDLVKKNEIIDDDDDDIYIYIYISFICFSFSFCFPDCCNGNSTLKQVES